MKSSSQPPSSNTSVLETILQQTQSKTGVDYFRAIVRNLTESLGAWGCWVTEYYPETRHMVALAFFADGKYIRHYEYDIDGTACQPAVDEAKTYHIGDDLVDVFPENESVIKAKTVSYIGSPIKDAAGNVIGLLGLMDRKPLTNKVAISLFELFAERAEAELQRIRLEKEIVEREERLRLIMSSAMDAILLLTADMQILRASDSAAKTFGFSKGQVEGQPLTNLLTHDSANQVELLIRSLSENDKSQSSLFIQNALKGFRKGGVEFAAEATLSRFILNGALHFCFILRDLNDAYASEQRIQELIHETEALQQSVQELTGDSEILGECEAMKSLASQIEQVAKTQSSVLILGETGVGKELVARSIYRKSSRAGMPFVCVNCAALPPNLIESELFGHRKGAFTGAHADREGRFAQANGGTLFLDEIGELPPKAQAKILRVLQEGEFEPLGSSKTQKGDVRIIAATHRNLKKRITEGKFREDLFFRLNVFPIYVPPLRDRSNDVLLLAEAIIDKLSQQMGKRFEKMDESSRQHLLQYNWPGNVRELQNTLERALIVNEGPRLNLSSVLPRLQNKTEGTRFNPWNDPDRILTVEEFRTFEADNISQALKRCNGRVSGEAGAAELLRMKPTTLASRIKALGIQQ